MTVLGKGLFGAGDVTVWMFGGGDVTAWRVSLTTAPQLASSMFGGGNVTVWRVSLTAQLVS